MQRAVLVRGIGDVGSAVAWVLFRGGHRVVVHDGPAPKTHRREMAFTDAVFDGEATLEGVTARRCDDPEELSRVVYGHVFIPVVTGDLDLLLRALPWDVVVDARMRKRHPPDPERGIAGLTFGLGPGHVAGVTADVAIETSWGVRLGGILHEGATLPLAGEPRAIEGIGRERNVYAPVPGLLRSDRSIGDAVSAGATVATIGETPIRAPISGTLRGLTRPGVSVLRDDKIVEVDPRAPDRAKFKGLGERPRRIADGVALAISQWREALDDSQDQRSHA